MHLVLNVGHFTLCRALYLPKTATARAPDLQQMPMYTLYASQTETWLYVEPKVVSQNPGEYILKVEGELRTPTLLLDFYTPTPDIQLVASEVEILEQVRALNLQTGSLQDID